MQGPTVTQEFNDPEDYARYIAEAVQRGYVKLSFEEILALPEVRKDQRLCEALGRQREAARLGETPGAR
jgi:hypothetical protein